MPLQVLRVFCAADGSGGNPLGVYLDGSEVPAAGRQARAAELGYSETIFVDDAARGVVRIFTPEDELPFAGHPMVGLGWLLGEVEVLHPPAGDIPTWQEGEDRWIRARPEWGPPFQLREHASPEEVDALEVPPELVYAWAWIDEGEGTVRARGFVAESGIPEDEATGSAAARLVAEIGRPIEIRQGKGSRIVARPGPDGTAEVGGRVYSEPESSEP